jgi:hypothetical protein
MKILKFKLPLEWIRGVNTMGSELIAEQGGLREKLYPVAP